MTDTEFPMQASLVYDAAPRFDFAALTGAANLVLRETGHGALMIKPQSTEVFALFGNDILHATIAIHDTPLRLGGTTGEKLAVSKAHVVISVRSGSDPVAFDKPEPASVVLMASLLQQLARSVHEAAPCKSVHIAASDRFFSADVFDDLDATLTPHLFLSPEKLTDVVGPEGQTGQQYVFHQSRHFVGRELVLRGVPAKVPEVMVTTLIDTLIHQHLNGAVALGDGDTISGSLDISLFVRHATSRDGRACVLVSFWPEPEGTSPQLPVFSVQTATSPAPAPIAVEDPDDWSAPGPGAYSTDNRTDKGSKSTWILLVGLGLFLWVGLPMLDIPQKVIKSAFSNDLSLVSPPQ